MGNVGLRELIYDVTCMQKMLDALNPRCLMENS